MCIQGNEKQIKLTDGRIKSCDECIQPLVQALNDKGFQTMASCCGHNKQPANIILFGGQELIIVKKFSDGRMIEKLFEPLHERENEWQYKIIRKITRFLLRLK